MNSLIQQRINDKIKKKKLYYRIKNKNKKNVIQASVHPHRKKKTRFP